VRSHVSQLKNQDSSPKCNSRAKKENKGCFSLVFIFSRSRPNSTQYVALQNSRIHRKCMCVCSKKTLESRYLRPIYFFKNERNGVWFFIVPITTKHARMATFISESDVHGSTSSARCWARRRQGQFWRLRALRGRYRSRGTSRPPAASRNVRSRQKSTSSACIDE